MYNQELGIVSDEYYAKITDYLFEFYENVPPILWIDATKKIVRPEGYGAMFRLMLEKGLFKDTKEISRDVAKHSKILLPATLIDSYIDMGKSIMDKITTNI